MAASCETLLVTSRYAQDKYYVELTFSSSDSCCNFLQPTPLLPNWQILAGSVDGSLRSYDMRMGLLHEDELGDPVVCVSATHNGKAALSLCLAGRLSDGGVHLTALGSTQAQGKHLQTYLGGRHHTYRAECCVLADDDKVAAGGEDGCVRVWSLQTGSLEGCTQSPRAIGAQMPPISAYDNVNVADATKAPTVCSLSAHPSKVCQQAMCCYRGIYMFDMPHVLRGGAIRCVM